jgi:hypothetical protein
MATNRPARQPGYCRGADDLAVSGYRQQYPDTCSRLPLAWRTAKGDARITGKGSTLASEKEYVWHARRNALGENFMSPSETNCPEETKVVVAALLHLIRLLAAEMVAGEGPHHDAERLLAAIDRRLNDTPLPGDTRLDVARAGLRQTRALLGPVAAQIRKQAAKAVEVERSLYRPANRLPA